MSTVLIRNNNVAVDERELYEDVDTTRIVNPAGYVSLSKTVANLLYNGNVSYFNNVLEHFDVQDDLKSEFQGLSASKIHSMSTIEKLETMQNINRKINELIYSGNVKRKQNVSQDVQKNVQSDNVQNAVQSEK